MKIKKITTIVFITILSISCDGIQERMEAERAYQEAQKQQKESIQSIWQFKEAGYDLEVSYSDGDAFEEIDKAELAQFTSKALREVADFPHLNIMQTGGKLGTVSVQYQVNYTDYLSEDKQLTWKIPSSLVATFKVDASERNKAGLWNGSHEAMASVPSTVEQLSEPLARGHALTQYSKLIESSVSQLQSRIGKHPVSDK